MDTAVLVVTSTGDASGVVTYVSAMAGALPRSCCMLAVPPGSDLERALPTGVRTVPCGNGRREMWRFLSERGRAFPVIQTHGARALLAARAAGVPRHHLEHVFHEFPRAAQRRSWLELPLAAGIRRGANTPELARALAALRLPVSAVLPPLVPAPKALEREAARRRLAIPSEAIALGVVGRLHRAKGPLLALDAVAALPAPMRDRAVLYYLGDGPLRRRLKRCASARRVRAVLPGHVSEASALLRAFDVVVVASRLESFGLTLAQAGLAGVPVAAVRSPGSQFVDADTGLLSLVPPSQEALAKRITAALTEDEKSIRLFQEHIRRRFGVESAGALYRDHFERLLAGATRQEERAALLA
jgi:glycosyltransferase involved in cell wall biosynthesis